MTDEATRRERLGIPLEAAEVVVICESTHWDPDWLATSTEYLRLMVAPTLDAALDALVAEPRRIYDVECAFYPEAYLRSRPERRDQFVRLANEGRLRFTGPGVTTPDTLLPEDEALLRDLAVGAEWLRSIGITAHPRSLYLPDSFGHSPGTPAVLRAAGLEYAAVSRIDGMRFPGAEMEDPDHFPVPGTSAARLTEEGTADFIWRAPDGSEVLTHWNAFGYGHGDMIGHAGFTRLMGLPLAWPSREPSKVAARIEGFIDQLRPLAAHTPYRLLAIGFDFSRPVPGLIDLIDTWNASGYARTGTWLVNAGLDDYFALVGAHREKLPTIELDPNPYWTGFYATRPALKRACRDLGRDLVTLDDERARRRLGDHADPIDECTDARWIAATANHHDLITGTSPDRTARREQWPWLHRAHDQVRRALTATDGRAVTTPASQRYPPADGTVVQRTGTRVTVTTPHFHTTFDEAHGGTLSALVDAEGHEVVHPRTLACVAIAESGGLWRMGCEFPGGTWRRVAATDDHPGTVTVHRGDDRTVVTVDATLEHRPVRLTVTFPDEAPTIDVTAEVSPRVRRTVTVQWRGAAPVDRLVMHQPGAVVTRPLHKRFEPTFWPLHSWTAVEPRDGHTDNGPVLALATAVPTAVHAWPSGTVEVVVARTAPRELAWGVVPLLGPAMGWERGIQTAHLAIGFAERTTPLHETGRVLWQHADRLAGRTPPAWAFTVGDDAVEIISVSPARNGDGTIVHLRNWAAADHPDPNRTVTLRTADDVDATISGACRCDTLEHDGEPLDLVDDRVVVPVGSYLTALRVRT